MSRLESHLKAVGSNQSRKEFWNSGIRRNRRFVFATKGLWFYPIGWKQSQTRVEHEFLTHGGIPILFCRGSTGDRLSCACIQLINGAHDRKVIPDSSIRPLVINVAYCATIKPRICNHFLRLSFSVLLSSMESLDDTRQWDILARWMP